MRPSVCLAAGLSIEWKRLWRQHVLLAPTYTACDASERASERAWEKSVGKSQAWSRKSEEMYVGNLPAYPPSVRPSKENESKAEAGGTVPST